MSSASCEACQRMASRSPGKRTLRSFIPPACDNAMCTGPGGGSEEKPVGTVHIALSHAGGMKERSVRFPGDREAIRWHASQLALDMVRLHFLYNGGEPPRHDVKRS